jgi:CheY-like chemotaxis protein
MLSNTTILYLDDDPDDLEFFKEVTDDMEIPSVLFNDSDALMSRMQNQQLNSPMIFLDLNMPKRSGYEIISQLRQSGFTNTPIIVYSTATVDTVVTHCRKLGANLYIPKVTSYRALRKVLEFALSIDWDNYVTDKSNFFYGRKPGRL